MSDSNDERDYEAPGAPPIPEALHSEHSRRPFDRCIACSADLLGSGVLYAIQKALRDGEAVLEFAICLPCMSGESVDWSEESRTRVEEWRLTHPLCAEGLDRCCICARLQEIGTDDAVIFTLARGTTLVLPAYVACDECVASLDSLLSDQTRRALDEFGQRHFPGIPAGLDAPIRLMLG